jgi:tRNA uridine 5-carboxymethylaminomethyl modification enzyme
VAVRRAGHLIRQADRVTGLAFEDGGSVSCRALVITTGTFLNGLVHVGDEQRPAGRAGEPPTQELATSLRDCGFEMGRLKTGTPPRLHRRSIDFSQFQAEYGDESIVPFSFMSGRIGPNQIACHVLYSTERVHDVVRRNIGRSPLYNGQIGGSDHGTARRSKTKSCDFRIASGTKSFWSPRAWTSTRSTSTACR